MSSATALALAATFALAALAPAAAASADLSVARRVEALNAANPHAVFSVEAALAEPNKGGGYHDGSKGDRSTGQTLDLADADLDRARDGPTIDWRDHSAVGPIQQQHPFGTCWAFSMTAVTEAVNVIQGKNAFQKLSEQMTVSCVPATASGDNADVLWSWAYHNTAGKYQTETVYPYNRTCNFFREQQLAPDGTNDGYPGTCNLPGSAPYGPCPPCPGVERKDGTPSCRVDKSKEFSSASVQGWAFIGPHGVADGVANATATSASTGPEAKAPFDVTRMLAALVKYGPAQIGIDASCVEGYKSGIITNCTSHNVDHAVAIVGAGTDVASKVDYWIVRNSWNTTFGEDGYFRVQRDTQQMGIFGGYFACFDKDCKVDPWV